MITPCIQRCEIDRTTKTCIGCKRTLAEIAAWGRLTDDDRLRVMDDLPKR